MNKEEFKEVVLREKEKSLHISRVPKKIKEEFTAYAEEEFAGDYGLLLREVWEKYKEQATFQEEINLKINYIIQMLENSDAGIEEKQEKPEVRKTLSGRELKGGLK